MLFSSVQDCQVCLLLSPYECWSHLRADAYRKCRSLVEILEDCGFMSCDSPSTRQMSRRTTPPAADCSVRRRASPKRSAERFVIGGRVTAGTVLLQRLHNSSQYSWRAGHDKKPRYFARLSSVIWPPLRGYRLFVYCTQGCVNARCARIALPWASFATSLRD